MSDNWSRVSRASSVFGPYKYKAEPQTASKPPGNNSCTEDSIEYEPVMSTKVNKDGRKSKSSKWHITTLDAITSMERSGASPGVESAQDMRATNNEVYGAHPEGGRGFNLHQLEELQCFPARSRDQNRATSISDFTLPIEDMSKQIGNPVKLPAPGGSHGASPMHNSASHQLASPYAYQPWKLNAPKKPLTPYKRYFIEVLPLVQKEMDEDPDRFIFFDGWNGPMSASDIAVKRWSRMTGHERAPYKAAYQAELKDYEVAMTAYRSTEGPDKIVIGSGPVYDKVQPYLAAPSTRDASTSDTKKQQTNFQRATADTESEPGRSRPASMKGSDGGWGAVRSSNRGWSPEDCDCANCLGLSENDSWASPVLKPKTTKDAGGCGRNSSVGWGSPAPRRDGWGAASVSLDGDKGGSGSGGPQEERLGSTPAPKNYPAEGGRSTKCVCPGWCNCGRRRNAMLQSHKKYSPWGWPGSDDDTVSVASEGFTRNTHFQAESECSEDAVLRLRNNRGGNSKLDNGGPTANTTSARPAYTYADVLGGAGGVHNATNNPKQYPSQQPAAVGQHALANHQATVANYEAYIRELQGQVQTRDRELDLQQQLLARYPPNLNAREDVASAAAKKESHVSTGVNTGLRKEADFLRQRLASGSLSTEDRAKAIDIISLIEGKPFEEPLVKSTSKAGTVKSTSFNISSNGHENGSTNLALDLKMHDLTKSITKMKAFDKFRRMQQDSDRLARIEEKLAKSDGKSTHKSKDKPKESDRVISFQKRTAREVEKLNRRLDELLSKESTDPKKKSDVSQELQTIRSLIDNLSERVDDSVDLVYGVKADIQSMRKTLTTSQKASASDADARDLAAESDSDDESMDVERHCLNCFTYVKSGSNCPDCGTRLRIASSTTDRSSTPDNQKPGPSTTGVGSENHARPTRFNDYSPLPSGFILRHLYSRDSPSPAPGSEFQHSYEGCWGCGGFDTRCDCSEKSVFESEIETPGRVGTIGSSVKEDCGLIETFNKKNSSSPGIATPESTTEKEVDAPFTAEEDATLMRMKREGKLWSEIIEVLGRNSSMVKARYKQIKAEEADKQRSFIVSPRVAAKAKNPAPTFDIDRFWR